MDTDSIERIVILGAGQAGGWAAKTLRDAGFSGHITLIGEESHPPHERPPLSKAVLAGTAGPASTHLFKPALFEGLRLDWRFGSRAVAIDRALQMVELADGGRVSYDRLIICTGGRSRKLEVPGAGDAPIHTLRSINDSLALHAVLRASRRLLVVGGGWIGLEVAATARTLGIEVHILEAMPRLCARVLPPALSDLLSALHERHGVTISRGVTVVHLERRNDGTTLATLDDGVKAVADCIVAGVGLVPNDELAQAAGLAWDRGVVVDRRCATSDPRIFAAGDVAVAPNAHAEGIVRLESWQNAQDQGIAAARAALGQDVCYDPLPRFWSDQYGTNIQILGWPRSSHNIVIRGDIASNHFLAFAMDAGRIRAAVGFNAARELRAARKLVESQAAIDADTLSDTTRDLTKMSVTVC
jgi:3-phenylpropionate/trans-cinnamate dioxygenase ferredoxin reductase subunit